MNEIRVARIEFAAYLQSSALAVSITMIGAPVRVNGRVQLPHRRRRALVVRFDADDDAIGLHEVFDRRALLEELRIADDAERLRRLASRSSSRTRLRRADRHGALVDDDGVLVHRAADVARHGEHVLQIGRAVLALRRADGDEDDLGRPDGGRADRS